jgi:squalene synthase HpnC
MAATVEEAYKACATLARSHYENFSVGSALLPKGTKQHLWALYAFARTTDDLGDEDPDSADYLAAVGPLPRAADRLAQLEAWERDLRSPAPSHPLMVAVRDTIRKYDIPLEPFLKLIEANRMDQRSRRHETYADLARYCDFSANPCGQLVLYLFGVRDEAAFQLSDRTCTALQLTNFWQDIAVDWAKGRVYLPQEDLRTFGYAEGEIAAQVVNEPFRKLMAFEVDRTRALFKEGLKLLDRLRGRAKFDIRLFSLGGMRVLDLIEKNGYDVFRKRPKLSKLGKAWLAVSSVLGVAS